MGQFITVRNQEKLTISFAYTSLAKRYRQGKFYIINRDNATEIFQLVNTGPQEATVSKKDLYKNSLLIIRLQCIVSKDLLDRKKMILENTLVDQKIKDERKEQDYRSDHTKDPTEYTDKTKYTFVISKSIEIKFEQ